MEIKNVGQLITALAKKVGVEDDNKHLIDLLSNAELSKVPIHSDLTKSLDQGLISLEAAMDNHPSIGAKYKAQALSAVDSKIESILGELDIDDAEKDEIKGIKSSYARLDAVANKMKELVANGSNGKDKAESEKVKSLQKQVDELQSQLKEKNEEVARVTDAKNTEINSIRTDFLLNSKLAGKKTVYDTLSEDLRNSSLRVVIEKALKEHDATISYDENGNPVLLKKDGSKVYGANNTQITIDSLIESALASNKLLVVTNTGSGSGSQSNIKLPINVEGGKQPEIDGTNQGVVDFNLSQLQAASEN